MTKTATHPKATAARKNMPDAGTADRPTNANEVLKLRQENALLWGAIHGHERAPVLEYHEAWGCAQILGRELINLSLLIENDSADGNREEAIRYIESGEYIRHVIEMREKVGMLSLFYRQMDQGINTWIQAVESD